MNLSRNVLAVYGAIAIVMLLLDLLWLGLIATPLYQQGIGHLMADEPRWAVALVFYAGYPVGLVLFAVLPQAGQTGVTRAGLLGALFGLIAYGTYDLTNLATLRDWPLGLSLLDMGWGALVSALSSAAGKVALDRLPPV